MTIEKLKQEWEDYGYLDDLESFDVVDEGDWSDEGKYQLCSSIVKSKETGKYYAIHESRSGNGRYYFDYDYGDPEFNEVERIEEVKVVSWKAI